MPPSSFPSLHSCHSASFPLQVLRGLLFFFFKFFYPYFYCSTGGRNIVVSQSSHIFLIYIGGHKRPLTSSTIYQKNTCLQLFQWMTGHLRCWYEMNHTPSIHISPLSRGFTITGLGCIYIYPDFVLYLLTLRPFTFIGPLHWH